MIADERQLIVLNKGLDSNNTVIDLYKLSIEREPHASFWIWCLSGGIAIIIFVTAFSCYCIYSRKKRSNEVKPEEEELYNLKA